MTRFMTTFEASGEHTHTLPYTPPFGLIGISQSEVLSSANPDAYRELQQYRTKELHDALVAFVDSLGGVGRTHNHEPMDGLLPEDATVADHLAISQPKFDAYLRQKDVRELVDRKAYIGPFIVASSQKPLTTAIEVVRLALFLPSPKSELDY